MHILILFGKPYKIAWNILYQTKISKKKKKKSQVLLLIDKLKVPSQTGILANFLCQTLGKGFRINLEYPCKDKVN